MLPTISIVIPTLNVAQVLDECLASIQVQTYPKNLLEIIVVDAGSTDGTLEVAKCHGVTRILPNPLKTGEAGKAVGLREAHHEIIALIDSDNVLPNPDWLERMMRPFADAEIVATESIEYAFRKTDGYITRYCAMLGMNDPLCLFLGNYDRHCLLTGTWTERPRLFEQDGGDYLKVKFDPAEIPTIGANGFCIRRSALEGVKHEEYLFDVDVLVDMFPRVAVAKVKTGIIHIYTTTFGGFLKKQRRRIRDFGTYGAKRPRKYPWARMLFPGGLWFGLSCLTVVPLLWQSWKGYWRSSDPAWFFHPVACYATLWVYGMGVTKKMWKPGFVALWIVMGAWGFWPYPEEPLGEIPRDRISFAAFVVKALEGEGTLTRGERAALVAHAKRGAMEGWLSDGVEELNDHVVGAYTAISELMRQWENVERRERGVFGLMKGLGRRMWLQSAQLSSPDSLGRDDFLTVIFTAKHLSPYAARTIVRALNVAEMGNSEDPGRWPARVFAPYLLREKIMLSPVLRPLALEALKRSPPLVDRNEEDIRRRYITHLEDVLK